MANELFYPEIAIEIGDYIFENGIVTEVYSSQSSYYDWAKVVFTKQFNDLITINRLDVSAVKLGYAGELSNVFTGYVDKPVNSSTTQNEMILKDKMILLENVFITNTFLNVTPQELVIACLKEAGITDYIIASKMFIQKKAVSIFKKNVISILQEINTIWDIKETFFFSDGVFYWGEKPSQSTIYQFDYAENIIALERLNSFWELETVSAPFIKHSHKIIVNHPDVTGEFEVKKVIFTTNESGFIRTRIYF